MAKFNITKKITVKKEHNHTKKFYSDPHFYVNIAVGILIAVIYHFAEDTRFGIKNLDYIFDLFIKHESSAAQAAFNNGESISNFSKDIVFIDFTYSNYKERGAPQYTPGDLLARNLFLADSCGAKIIVVDYLFNYKDYQYPSNDDSLRNVIKRIAGAGRTKLIFPVVISSKDKRLKPNIFDELINNYDNLFIGLPAIVSSSHDGVVRYTGSRAEYIKSSEGGNITYAELDCIPAIVSRLRENPGLSKKDLYKEKTENVSAMKEAASAIENEHETEGFLYNKRIRFLMIPGDESDSTFRTGNIPPEQYFDMDKVIPGFLKNKIVIIGSSNSETGDMHLTPIGEIPGMYVLGNSINTEIMHLNPEEIPFVFKLIVELLVIILASFLFYHYHEFFAQLLTAFLLLILLGAINYFLFFNYGIFINFILPVLGIGLHRIISSFEVLFSAGVSKKHSS